MTNLETCWKGGLGALMLTLSNVAMAQFDYSAFGVVDLSYGRFEPSGALHENRFNSNSMTASFVGVNAKYGLDGGWTPGITLETFVRFQDGEIGRRESDPPLSRNAFASLGSEYGTWRIGRLQTFLFDATTRFNAMGNSVGFSPAVRHVFASGNLEGVQGDFYWDRAVSYGSPSWDGVTVSAMYGQDSAASRGTYGGITIIYAEGLFASALSAQSVSVDDGINDAIKERTWQLAVTYNFGEAKVFGEYTQMDDRGLDVRSRIASAGIALPVGPGTVQAQAAYTTTTGPAVDRKHTTVSAAYVWVYDSVTDFYFVAMDDRIRSQTEGVSAAIGVRYRF